MRPVVTDQVAWSFGWFVTLVSPAKTAAPIEMPFGLTTLVGSRNHVLHAGSRSSVGRGDLEEGKGHPIVKYRDTAIICAKLLNRSRCRLGCGLGWAIGIMVVQRC